YLTVTLPAASLFIVILHEPECGLIGQSADCPGTEGLPFPENDFRIFVCLALIVSGEIEVNVRLLIPLESKESLKRNIKSIFDQRCTADRTFFIFHIPSASSGKFLYFFRVKVTVMTVRTIVMRT